MRISKTRTDGTDTPWVVWDWSPNHNIFARFAYWARRAYWKARYC